MNIVEKDNSTFQQKLDAVLIDHPEYLNAIYWAKKDVLGDEYDYIQCMLAPKSCCKRKVGQDTGTKKGNGQLSEFFKYEPSNFLENDLFITRITVPIKRPRQGKFYECNTASYILNTIQPSKNHPAHPLQFVLLNRYDANMLEPHQNDFTPLQKILFDKEMNTYKKYFKPQIAPKTPHFHYGNNFTSPTNLTAIDLDSLINYILDLRRDNNPKSILNTNSFFMPYLDIKKFPKLYYTNHTDLEKLTPNKLNKIITDTSLMMNGVVEMQKGKPLYGLEAVLYDLTLISYLHSINFNGVGELSDPIMVDFELYLGSKIGGNIDGFENFFETVKNFYNNSQIKNDAQAKNISYKNMIK